MENHVLLIALSAVAVIAILYLHIKRWSRKIRVNLDNDQGIRKFIELLFIYDQKKVFLNIKLSFELAKEFRNASTISLPQIYRSKILSGGFRVVFEKTRKDTKNKVFFEPDRLKGYFKVIHGQGPELGWYTILMISPE